MSAKPAKKTPAKKAPAVPKKPVAKKVAEVVEVAPVVVAEATPVVAEVAVVVPPVVVATPAPTKASKSVKKDKKPRTRREINRESVDASFVELQKKVEEEIEKLRASTEKVKGVKFLRT